MSLSIVTCPSCGGKFNVQVTDYKVNPEEKYCYCIHCQAEFGVLEGKPWPPLDVEQR